MWRILLVLTLGASPLTAQSAEDIAGVYSTVFDVASEALDSATVCLVPAKGHTFAPASAGAPPLQLERPTGESHRILEAVAHDRLGDRLVSYCIARPRSGFESAVERARRSVELSIQGPTYHYFDPYGAAVLQLRVSAPWFDSPNAARISARLDPNSNQSTEWVCHVLRDPGGSWYAHDCRVRHEIAESRVAPLHAVQRSHGIHGLFDATDRLGENSSAKEHPDWHFPQRG